MTSVISQLGLSPHTLQGETVIVTGAGGGIGYEAARALLWLGANVVIAEIDQQSGRKAEVALEAEFGTDRILFVPTDVGDEASVKNLYNLSVMAYGKVDVVINNATIAVLGMVKDLPIEAWDRSYHVNLRGPVLMARAFLPEMIQRNHGVFVCVSSTGTAFLGGYETFKAAQVHLANTLDAELEGTEVIAYTIGPGLVPTATASKAVAQLAPQMGISVEKFFEMNRSAVLSVEEAGAGFAVSVVFAAKFRGQEISSIQALKAANINFGGEKAEHESAEIRADQRSYPEGHLRQAQALCEKVRLTLQEQSDDWKRRSLFERQWVIRDFRKTTGMPVEEWLETLCELAANLQRGAVPHPPPLTKLAGYYEHLAELAKGYEKDPEKLAENLRHVYGWRDEVQELTDVISKGQHEAVSPSL
ncbi:MAG TPA: SDR family NAD(P)-dependent oxidoreductase [Anaerolineales bacterium]|nr:SDR family NAD(P)-dependent oxidoreductase [Anaerolineales bacterium]